MSKLHKYEAIRREGGSPHLAWHVATADGLGFAERIRLLREVFELSLVEAKRVHIESDHGIGLEEYQASLNEALDAALSDEE